MVPLIALAAQKRHLSLYVCAVVDGGYLAERRAERLGQGLLRQELHPVHLARPGRRRGAHALVRDAVAATAAGQNAYSAALSRRAARSPRRPRVGRKSA